MLRGWFIFDGPDYAKKKGAPITYEMISQTDADIKSEVLDKRKKRQEEREKAGVGAVKKATVAPISRSRRATAGKAAAKLGAEGDSENEIENGDENEDDAPPLSDEEPVGRVISTWALILDHFSALCALHTPCVCPTWCRCFSDADWCVQPDVV